MTEKKNPFLLSQFTIAVLLLTNYDVKQHRISQTGCLTSLRCRHMLQNWHLSGQANCLNWNLLLFHEVSSWVISPSAALQWMPAHHLPILSFPLPWEVEEMNCTACIPTPALSSGQIPDTIHLNSVWHHLQQRLYLHITISDNECQEFTYSGIKMHLTPFSTKTCSLQNIVTLIMTTLENVVNLCLFTERYLPAVLVSYVMVCFRLVFTKAEVSHATKSTKSYILK